MVGAINVTVQPAQPLPSFFLETPSTLRRTDRAAATGGVRVLDSRASALEQGSF